ESIGVGAINIGMGEQNLADRMSCRGDAAHRPDLIPRLALFDDGLALHARPSIVIERANHRPHLFGRMIEHDAVVGFCHVLNLLAINASLLVHLGSRLGYPFLAMQFPRSHNFACQIASGKMRSRRYRSDQSVFGTAGRLSKADVTAAPAGSAGVAAPGNRNS